MTDDASLLFDRSENVTVADSVSGTRSLTQAGSGTLSLTGANSYGATTVSTGTLQVGDGNAGSLGTGDVTDAAALVFDTTTGNNVTIGNTIDGGGSLTQAGSNTLILTGANGFAGTTTAVEGVLLTGALASTISVSGDPIADTGATYTVQLSPGTATLGGWQIEWGDGGASSPGPTDTSASYTYSTLGSYTITATARDTSGNRGTAEVAVKVSMTTPVFAINTGRPVSAGTPVNWQTHVFVDDGGTNLNDGAYEFQFPAAGLNGPVTYKMSPESAAGEANDPPPGATLSPSGLLMYTFTSADAWKTYDIFVTATDSTNLTDQYELVLTTNTFQHGQSMAAGSPWYGMNESTSTDPQTCGVQFPQWPSPNSAPFLNVQVVITQLPADGTLFIGGTAAVVGEPYDASQISISNSAYYQPNTNFCGLDTIRYYFNYQSIDQTTNEPVNPCTNTGSIAVQVGPWVRIAGQGVYSETQSCQGYQVGYVDEESAVILGGSGSYPFDIEANNPREDGVPTELSDTISFSGIRVFGPGGQEYHSGDVVTDLVSGTVADSTSGGEIPLLIEPIPGSGGGSLTVDRSAWSCAEQSGPYGNLEYPGWYFGVLANVNITIVSAILHGVDYHSNNLNQKTGLDLSCPQVEHDPPSAGPPAPGGSYGAWEWLDDNDDGSATNDAGDHDFPVCYTTSGGPVNGDVKLKTEVQIDASAIPPDKTGIVVSGDGQIGNLSQGGVSVHMAQIGTPAVTLVNGKQRIDVWLQSVQDVPATILDTYVGISWKVSFYGGAATLYVGTSTNRIYLTWRNAKDSPVYETLLYIGCDAASGLTSSSSQSDVVNAIWSKGFASRSVHRVDGTLLRYTSDPGTVMLSDIGMLGSPTGSGQCSAWSQLLVDVLGAQGIAASGKKITAPGYERFDVIAMPAQGAANCPESQYYYHVVVTVDGFPNTIFDPSYGTMVPGTSLLAAEQQYEDLYVPDVVNPNGTWQPDPPGAPYYLSFD